MKRDRCQETLGTIKAFVYLTFSYIPINGANTEISSTVTQIVMGWIGMVNQRGLVVSVEALQNNLQFLLRRLPKLKGSEFQHCMDCPIVLNPQAGWK